MKEFNCASCPGIGSDLLPAPAKESDGHRAKLTGTGIMLCLPVPVQAWSLQGVTSHIRSSSRRQRGIGL